MPDPTVRLSDLNPAQQRLVRLLADIAKRVGKRP